MEAMAQEWTDGRLDDLSKKVDQGFARVDRSFEQVGRRFEKVDADIRDLRLEMRTEFTAMRSEIGAIQRTMVQGFIALTAAMLAGFGGLAALLATQA
jgi:hypothetical protein